MNDDSVEWLKKYYDKSAENGDLFRDNKLVREFGTQTYIYLNLISYIGYTKRFLLVGFFCL